jgi:hypothetical protein
MAAFKAARAREGELLQRALELEQRLEAAGARSASQSDEVVEELLQQLQGQLGEMAGCA